MPKIIIRDRDLTTAVGSITSSYGVFVPGLVGSGAPSNYPTTATEYTSLAAFKADMGSAPQELASGITDIGYMYACELLGAGLPVIYKTIPLVTTLASQQDYFTETFQSGVSTISKNPVGNTEPGTTNLVDSMTVFNENGDTLTGIESITVDSTLKITILLDSDSSTEYDDIYSVVYQYQPEGYVDPSTVSVEDICNAINGDSTFFTEIVDRGLFDVSFVTTGGYPTVWSNSQGTRSNMIAKLTSICATRGDCFALIDFEQDFQFKVGTDGSVVDGDGNAIPELSVETSAEDSFIIVPWTNFAPNYSGLSSGENFYFPGSFAFLKCFAGSIKTNNSWFATAGVRRGAVACNGVTQVITNTEADSLQPAAGRSVNAITYIKPYGYVIYGNRTLFANNETGLVANSFINIRQLVHDIKRQVYTVAKSLMFDPNDDILWVNFKNSMTPLLERMRSGQGISSFRLVKIRSSARGTMTAKIVVAPIEAVETFNITVELTDEDVTVVG